MYETLKMFMYLLIQVVLRATTCEQEINAK